MANHLVSRHAAPTPLAVRTYPAQAIQHFFLVAIIQEGSHLLDVHFTSSWQSLAQLHLWSKSEHCGLCIDFPFSASLPLQPEFHPWSGRPSRITASTEKRRRSGGVRV